MATTTTTRQATVTTTPEDDDDDSSATKRTTTTTTATAQAPARIFARTSCTVYRQPGWKLAPQDSNNTPQREVPDLHKLSQPAPTAR